MISKIPEQNTAESWVLCLDLPLIQVTLSKPSACLSSSSVLIYKNKGLEQIDNERDLSIHDSEASGRES